MLPTTIININLYIYITLAICIIINPAYTDYIMLSFISQADRNYSIIIRYVQNIGLFSKNNANLFVFLHFYRQ